MPRGLTKFEVRSWARERRAMAVGADLEALSLQVLANLWTLPDFAAASKVLSYVSRLGEVSTSVIFARLRAEGRSIAIPRVLDSSAMTIDRLAAETSLETGPFGLERLPEGSRPGWTPEVALLPGLAFDLAGNRVGFGCGHWDRYLERADIPIAIGLAFDWQIVTRIEAEPTDRPVQWIVTESQIWRATPREAAVKD